VRNHLFNAVIMNVGFMGIFAAFNATQNLESSIVSGILGYWAVAAIYAAFCFGALFVSSPAVNLLKPKLSMIIGSLSYAGLMAGNIFPSWAVLIPAASLCGLGASVLWAAQGSYLTAAAGAYALNKGQDLKSALGFFNGLFFGMFQSAIVVGNLVAAIVLSHATGSSEKSSIQFLFYIFLGIALAGTLMLCFLQSDLVPVKSEQLSTGGKILQTFIVMKDPRMMLISFIIFFNGLEQGFWAGDITRVCIAETIGKGWVGYVSCVFAATDALASLAFGKIADVWGKKTVVFIGFLSHAATFVFLLVFLTVGPGEAYFIDNKWVLFMIAGLYGVGDAAWNTFSGIIIGYFFTDQTEAGFSNSKLFSSLGAVVAFVWGPHFFPKLYFCIAILGISMICLVILDRFVAPIDDPKPERKHQIQ